GSPGGAPGCIRRPPAGAPSCSAEVPSVRCAPPRAGRLGKHCETRSWPPRRGNAEDSMSKRIHELAKDWGQNPQDLLAVAARVGLRGKRSQSSLTDDEVVRLREGLGLAQRPAVTIGSERVVAERVVTQRDSDADQLVTAIEQTTETRLRPNVIRRRTAREVLKREELPPAVPEAEPAPAEIPPSLDFEPDIPPPVNELPPPAPGAG